MNYKKLISIILLTISLLLTSTTAATALPPTGQGYGGVYRVNSVSEPKTLNSHVMYDFASLGIVGNIYSRLVCTDWGVVEGIPEETGGIVGDLAKDWDVSSDGLTFTFYLYEDAKWSDGKALTSADVVYTLNQVLTNSALRRHFWLKETMGVTSVTASDDHRVVIKTRKFNADWLVTFAQYNNWELFILPKHIYEGTDWLTNPANDDDPVTSGPFLFDTWVKGSYIRLRRNPDYYLAPYPFVDEVIIRFLPDPATAWAALKAGELDAINYESNPAYAEVALAEKTVPGLALRQAGSVYSYPVHINHKSEYLSNKDVRKAVAYAVNRDEIVQKGFFGLWVTNDMFAHQGSIWGNPNARLPSHDKAMAEKLLDDAGYTRGADGWRFELLLTQSTAVACMTMSEVVKEQLEEVGIKINWQVYDIATYTEKFKAGEWDLISRWTRYGPSPNDGFGNYFHTRDEAAGWGLDNYFGFSNAEVDALVEEALTISDFDDRKALYDQVQEILAEEIATLEMAFEQKLQLSYSDWHGLTATPEGLGVAGNWFSFKSVWNEAYVQDAPPTPTPPPSPDQPDWYKEAPDWVKNEPSWYKEAPDWAKAQAPSSTLTYLVVIDIILTLIAIVLPMMRKNS
jgi:peptide/nickel transport system substrate-binding protein